MTIFHHHAPRVAALLASGSMLASVATGALAQDYDADAIINIGSLYEAQNLDNIAGVQGVHQALYANSYESLFLLNDAGQVENLLATGYEASEDGLTYAFTLRDGVSFHSGDPLTAADVKFSIERVASEVSKSARKKSLSNIVNIETPDDLTVVITLSSPSISLPYNLSYIFVQNDTHEDFANSVDGTGPYELESFRRGASVALTRNDDYWGEAPTNGGITFNYFTDATALSNALLTGAVDVVTGVESPDALAQFKNNPDFIVTEGASTTKEVFAFNDRIEPFSNVTVRKAVSRAINKKRLLNSVWGDYGTLIGSFVPPTDPWFTDLTGVDAYDPESAKAMLEEAGYADGFTMTIDTPNVDPHPLVAQALQADLSEVGITVDINLITANEWYTKIYQSHDFDATLMAHVNHRDIGFYGIPDFYWGYNNPEVVELIASAETAASEDEQVAKLAEANKIMAEDAASVWLYLNPKIIVSSADVTGYPVNGLNSQFFGYDIRKAD
ncbi:ABC transporter substrate-binding protein [Pukyongiella litopenaei]|uniref:ABC transporter substrate-binding protein n=1 Tax=Pukyongiella litopenaei TaxID=2605946 RepID=A0A2S0MQV5_9RHOB|nr:ABC transporter substrate-binding protein [Pukyongiella litopenaei]AVO38270.1 ABC transporter substrate-binding protein [Pukyongiella litopenaei]